MKRRSVDELAHSETASVVREADRLLEPALSFPEDPNPV